MSATLNIANVDIIADTLSDALSTKTSIDLTNDLLTFKNQLQRCLNNLDNKYAEIKETYNKCALEYNQTHTKMLANASIIGENDYYYKRKKDKATGAYISASRTNNFSWSLFSEIKQIESWQSKTESKIHPLLTQLETLLKQDVLLIEKIRQEITGQIITYQIGFVYYGHLYEKTATLEQILSYTSLAVDTDKTFSSGFKLRLGSTSQLREELFPNTSFPRTQNLDRFEKLAPSYWSGAENEALFNRVVAYAASRSYKNQGNNYEVYRNIIAGDTRDLAQIFASVRANTDSSVLGGDIGDEQDKLFGGGSSFSVMSTTTVRNTLQSLIMICDNYIHSANDINSLKNSLTSLFVKDMSEVVYTEAEQYAREYATVNTNELFKSVTVT